MRLFIPTTVATLIAVAVSVSSAQSPAAETPPAVEGTQADSLFAEAPRQFEAGGRWSSIDGDPARYQRYEDIRDGFLLDKVRWGTTREKWLFQFGADNVGWRDQRYRATYERPGRFSVTGLWDEIPQFYSVDTKTPYTSRALAVRSCDDATQLAIQNGQANLNAYVRLPPSSTCVNAGTSAASISRQRCRNRSTSRLALSPRSTAASSRGAPASGSATMSKWRCPTTHAPTTSASAPNGAISARC